MSFESIQKNNGFDREMMETTRDFLLESSLDPEISETGFEKQAQALGAVSAFEICNELDDMSVAERTAEELEHIQ